MGIQKIVGVVVGVVGIAAVATVHVLAASLPKNVQVQAINSSSATIIWETSQAEQSRLVYGTSVSYGSTVSSATATTSHSLFLDNLRAGTKYYYQVADNANNPIGKQYSFVTPYEFGVVTGTAGVNTDMSHISDMYAKGIQYKNLELAWDALEPANGTYNSSYIAAKKTELANYQAAGYKVILDLGTHYTPTWVRTIDANALFKNQYGVDYAPNSPGQNIANVIFNNTVRTEMNSYIQKVFSEFGTDFYATRAGGLWNGELHYPVANYGGNVNSFWAFDANAQGTASNLPAGVSASPVPGWVPNPIKNGTFEYGNDGSWTTNGTDSLVGSGTHRGTNALQKVNPGAFTNQSQQENIPLVVGKSYTVSAWVKSTNPSAPACFQLLRANTAAEITFQCSGSSTYQQISHTFTAQDTTVKLSLLTYDGAPTTLTFDDINIVASGYDYDADNSDARAFATWYQSSLDNYQNWQIDAYRNAGYDGEIFMLYPGFGVRDQATTNWTEESIAYDLSYTSQANTTGTLPAGENWDTAMAALPTADKKITAYNTWLDAVFNDASANKADWSPAKYMAEIAHTYGRKLYGENTGNNNLAGLQQTFTKIVNNNYNGLFWFRESQLYDGTHVSAAQYAAAIADADQTAPYNLRITNGEVTNDGVVALTLSAEDNVSTAAGLQMMLSESPDFTGSSYVAFSPTAQFTFSASSSAANRVIYYRVIDAQGNVSNTIMRDLSTAVSVPAAPNTGFSVLSNSFAQIVVGATVILGAVIVILYSQKRAAHRR